MTRDEAVATGSAAQAALKAATRQALAAAGGPEAAAALFGVSAQTAWRWGAPEHPEMMPLRHVPVLEAAGPSVTISRALAALQGCALVPAGAPSAPADLARAAAKVSKRAGRVLEAAGEALADGRVCGREALRVVEALAELEALCAQLRRAMAAR